MLIEKLQKYQPHHQGKLINMNILLLSSGKIDKYEYLTGGEILPSNQQQIIEQAKFTDSPFVKAFEKQTKTIGDRGKNKLIISGL